MNFVPFLRSFALTTLVACAVIGLSNVDEIRQAVEVARKYKPLSREEKAALVETGKRLAVARGLYYGPVTG